MTTLDLARLRDTLRTENIASAIDASAVWRSPYDWLYVPLKGDQQIIVSDAAEYGDDGILVGLHTDEDADVQTVSTEAEALALVRRLYAAS